VIEAGDSSVAITTGTGPGSVVLDGLPATTTLDLVLRTDGRATKVGKITTLAPPPGRELARFATVNDMHIGERAFGLLPRVSEPSAVERYPVRCLRAALDEATAWGAQAVLAKGDLTWSGRQFQWESVAELLAGAGVPVHAVLGNHDVGRRAVDGREILRRAGITMNDDPWAVDLPGLRVVMVQTPIGLKSPGRIRPHQDAVLDLLSGSELPGFVAMHHYPQRFKHPTIYPRGIPGPEARSFLAAVAEVKPATFLSCGHSHRHRTHRRGPLVVTEIGSTKDHPGTWAGYVVHEGGIRQVVRRIAEPTVIAWTERAAQTVAGVWGWWSPGTLKQRCFSHTWPTV
jgi:predicted phosphodiesterase